MEKISRRSILKTVFSLSVIGFILPGRAKAADQPRMQAALDALKIAQRELQAATDDKGGHRVKALRLVNQAMDQVERGIRFDRRR
jgi:hypothetical protein